MGKFRLTSCSFWQVASSRVALHLLAFGRSSLLVSKKAGWCFRRWFDFGKTACLHLLIELLSNSNSKFPLAAFTSNRSHGLLLTSLFLNASFRA